MQSLFKTQNLCYQKAEYSDCDAWECGLGKRFLTVNALGLILRVLVTATSMVSEFVLESSREGTSTKNYQAPSYTKVTKPVYSLRIPKELLLELINVSQAI
ncbi:MAG: hypothetical protein V7K18_24715 [Nostoc sp.]|uniref:hypothetical protein n=1 Tax=Nostoc sp. TaxID=1180 RepID=UPI002FFC59C3